MPSAPTILPPGRSRREWKFCCVQRSERFRSLRQRAVSSALVHDHDAVSIIRAKRDGHALTDAQIDWVIDGFTRGLVPDEQMAALAMAIVWRGMTRAETH